MRAAPGPGVYVGELPGRGRTIVGVETAVAAFVGRAGRGPLDTPVPIRSYGDYERTFGAVPTSGLDHSVRDYYRNGGADAVVVRLAGAAVTATVHLGDGVALEAVSPGAWGNALQVEVIHASGAEATVAAEQQGVPTTALFHLVVREGDADAPRFSEQFENVTLSDGPRRLDRVLRDSELVRVSAGFVPPAMGRPSERHSGQAPSCYEAGAANGGTEGIDSGPLTLEDYIGGAADTFESAMRGIFALLKADLFTLLVLPPSEPDGDLPDQVWVPAISLCQSRRAILLIDPPAGQTVADICAWIHGLNVTAVAGNGALYYPRVRTSSADGEAEVVAPSGAVAGVIARTDTTRGVWKAPAGVQAGIVGVDGLERPMTNADCDELTTNGINCLRTLPGAGVVVWGARTLRGRDALDDEYKYVPVRRLALFLEESLHRSTQWVVFEPNAEPLWAQIRASVGGFLEGLFRNGAFQGSKPAEAYFVRCDATTTTQQDIDRGIVNILVGFAPLKPAEFLILRIQQKTAEAPG